jgi:hypothetical protein
LNLQIPALLNWPPGSRHRERRVRAASRARRIAAIPITLANKQGRPINGAIRFDSVKRTNGRLLIRCSRVRFRHAPTPLGLEPLDVRLGTSTFTFIWRTPLSLRRSGLVHISLRARRLSSCSSVMWSRERRRGLSLTGSDAVGDPGVLLELSVRLTSCCTRDGIEELSLVASRARVTSWSETGTTAAAAKLARTWTASCFAEFGSPKKPSRRK